MIATDNLIPMGHPNRPGDKLRELRALVIHWTQNDNPKMNDSANIRWIGREYKNINGKIYEADGKTPFIYGSAHIFCDKDSCKVAIPTNERAHGCGDRNQPFDAVFKGQQPFAKNVLSGASNYYTVSIEICNNDDWGAAVKVAREWCAEFLTRWQYGIDLDGSLDPQNPKNLFNPSARKLYVVRHHDVSGKHCPGPFVDHPEYWKDFVIALYNEVNK